MALIMRNSIAVECFTGKKFNYLDMIVIHSIHVT